MAAAPEPERDDRLDQVLSRWLPRVIVQMIVEYQRQQHLHSVWHHGHTISIQRWEDDRQKWFLPLHVPFWCMPYYEPTLVVFQQWLIAIAHRESLQDGVACFDARKSQWMQSIKQWPVVLRFLVALCRQLVPSGHLVYVTEALKGNHLLLVDGQSHRLIVTGPTSEFASVLATGRRIKPIVVFSSDVCEQMVPSTHGLWIACPSAANYETPGAVPAPPMHRLTLDIVLHGDTDILLQRLLEILEEQPDQRVENPDDASMTWGKVRNLIKPTARLLQGWRRNYVGAMLPLNEQLLLSESDQAVEFTRVTRGVNDLLQTHSDEYPDPRLTRASSSTKTTNAVKMPLSVWLGGGVKEERHVGHCQRARLYTPRYIDDCEHIRLVSLLV